MNKKEVKIVFFGTPEFSVPALLKLIEFGYDPLLVITQPDKPAGRNQIISQSPIKKIALDHNLPLAQPRSKKELIKIFKNIDCDLGVLAAFGQILPKIVLDKPKLGILNIHPSLLPKYRGSSPIQNAILNGDNKTGVSIIKLIDELDAGPIFAQAEVDLDQSENAEILHDKLANLGAELLVRILPGYIAGSVFGRSQNDSLATFTKTIDRQDGKINWLESAEEIERKFRAYTPWPGVFTYLDDKRLKIANLSVLKAIYMPNLPPGSVFLSEDNDLAVVCGSDGIILSRLQLEGKKELLAKDFALGTKIIGKILK